MKKKDSTYHTRIIILVLIVLFGIYKIVGMLFFGETDKERVEKEKNTVVEKVAFDYEKFQSEEAIKKYIAKWFWDDIKKIASIKDEDDKWYEMNFIFKSGDDDDKFKKECIVDEAPSENIKRLIFLGYPYEAIVLKKINENPILIYVSWNRGNMTYSGISVKGIQRCNYLLNSKFEQIKNDKEVLKNRYKEVDNKFR